ncbi:MAG: FAD-binding protein [Candidatus Brevundimonas phytovorans]|nr:FAD-binding protein [Brevundimonas sp.]WEK56739.1 MAG: FAD-binding protein [Brevundimonas sp.]
MTEPWEEAWWPGDIRQPARLDEASEAGWSHETDVVVVGFGGAGVCAALEARQGGCEVLALDRFEGGGATRINGGVYYAGGGTATQVEAGVEDTADNMFDYLRQEVQGVVSDETLARFCRESIADHAWLAAQGVCFNARLYEKKTSYPPTDYYLYHSDSSLAQSYAAKARPAARGHRVYMPAENKADGYGKGFFDPLRNAALRSGVKVLTQTTVEALILDDHGRVAGLEARQALTDAPSARQRLKLISSIKGLTSVPPVMPGAAWMARKADKLRLKLRRIDEAEGRILRIRARSGVVIAAGGHVFNREMIRAFSPDYAKGLPLGTPGDDGSGVALGLTAGGAMTGMERISAWRFINPPFSWARAPMVNSTGARFIDETLYGAAVGKAMCDGRDGKAWVILDRPLMIAARREASAVGVLPFQKWPALAAMRLGRKKAQSLEGLARQCGFDATVFKQAIAQHNEVAEGRQADPFDKRSSDAAALTSGPFYAVDVSIDAAFFPLPTLTLGGLKVDEATGQVLRSDGTGVAGLYAAGRSALGICSNLYVSGLSVADCVFSGRRAAKSLTSDAG